MIISIQRKVSIGFLLSSILFKSFCADHVLQTPRTLGGVRKEASKINSISHANESVLVCNGIESLQILFDGLSNA